SPLWRATLLLALSFGVLMVSTSVADQQSLRRLFVPQILSRWAEAPSSPTAPVGRVLLFADEFDGSALDPARWITRYWWGAPAKGPPVARGTPWACPAFAADCHAFAVDWRPGVRVVYVDGVERWRFTDTAAVPSQPMYLLLNLAVAGNPLVAPDGSTVFPAYY